MSWTIPPLLEYWHFDSIGTIFLHYSHFIGNTSNIKSILTNVDITLAHIDFIGYIWWNISSQYCPNVGKASTPQHWFSKLRQYFSNTIFRNNIGKSVPMTILFNIGEKFSFQFCQNDKLLNIKQYPMSVLQYLLAAWGILFRTL